VHNHVLYIVTPDLLHTLPENSKANASVPARVADTNLKATFVIDGISVLLLY
jgi:hypothetical protein